MRLSLIQRIRDWTPAEWMKALAITAALVTGLWLGTVRIRSNFLASRHYVDKQAEQMRVMDYINLDLRRALSVNAESERLIIKIPDFYNGDGQPRDPRILRGTAIYGATAKTVEYYREGAKIVRWDGATKAELATDVADFKLASSDSEPSIKVSLAFLTSPELFSSSAESARAGMTTLSSALLCEKRRN
jgi:hypothetical protein